jgi:hypothetical protein
MYYVRIEQGLLGWTVREVEAEGPATHVALKLVEHERAQASRERAQYEQIITALQQELQRARAELKQAQESIRALRAAKEGALHEKVNWRRRALAGVGLCDPEHEQRYECDRHEQWWRVVTVVLDVDSGDDYAALAMAMASAAAQELKGIPSKVWRNKGIWHAQLRVPSTTAVGLGRFRVRIEADADTKPVETIRNR